MKIFVLIPARLNSSRFPRKSLVKIGNESLIENVFKRCSLSKMAQEVCVLTDHEDIYNEVKRFNGNVIMTGEDLESGTDRVFEGAEKLNARDEDFIVNIQGDQAMLDFTLIDDLINSYIEHKNEADLFTFAKRIKSYEVAKSHSDVKVVLDKNNLALYFSRANIPYVREEEDKDIATFYKHFGIYGYSFGFLKTFVNLKLRNLEQIERLEQLRALENGYKIKVILTDKNTTDIDYPKDLEKIV